MHLFWLYTVHNYLNFIKEKEKKLGEIMEEERLKNKKHVILKILDLRERGMKREEILDIFIKKTSINLCWFSMIL